MSVINFKLIVVEIVHVLILEAPMNVLIFRVLLVIYVLMKQIAYQNVINVHQYAVLVNLFIFFIDLFLFRD